MPSLIMKRTTRQREAIWQALAKAGRPLSPQEVLKAAKRRVPNLGVATVYRTLNALVEEAALRTVEIAGHGARYERADLDHHHHFYCTRCKRVFDLDGCAMNSSYVVPKGFTVESHQITLSGRCHTCRD